MSITRTSAVSSAVAEALESPATTKAEAAKGDPQAIRKLAAQQAANPGQAAPQTAADPDHDGDPGKLNVTA